MLREDLQEYSEVVGDRSDSLNKPFGADVAVHLLIFGSDFATQVYRKALFQGYTDDTFTTLAPRSDAMGYLGPPLRAEVSCSHLALIRVRTRCCG